MSENKKVTIYILAVIICVILLSNFPIYEKGWWFNISVHENQIELEGMTLYIMIYSEGWRQRGTIHAIYFDKILLALVPIVVGVLLVSFIDRENKNSSEIKEWMNKEQ